MTEPYAFLKTVPLTRTTARTRRQVAIWDQFLIQKQTITTRYN